MKNFKLIVYTALILTTAACAPGGGSSTAIPEARIVDQTPADLLAPSVPPDAPVIATPALTYYRLSKTVAPINGWTTKTYTATASCVEYLTKTYCWDDGIKTLQWSSNNNHYGPYYYTYFGLLTKPNGTPGVCNGACTSDYMPAPRFISQAVESNIGVTGGGMTGAQVINAVFTQGTAVPVSCTETDGVLNCIDFAINLNQAPL